MNYICGVIHIFHFVGISTYLPIETSTQYQRRTTTTTFLLGQGRSGERRKRNEESRVAAVNGVKLEVSGIGGIVS